MKEALIVDLNGLMIDTTIVDNVENGVFELYNSNQDVIGYRVSVSCPSGLHAPMFDFITETWYDGKKFDLNQYKLNKIADLNAKCNAVILGTFESSALGVPHTYKYDDEAQKNFAVAIGIYNADVTMTEISWTTEDSGQLIHNRDQFLTLYKDAVITHLNASIYKYHTLKSKVEDATTDSEAKVDAIVW